ncbi:hypothetical protein [Paraburkholderia xenovorans]|uniref:hypothetical protein n=1 Tax=Paraburkholderia xenovorans TaxID=36873 RepID=UPI0015C5762F|nr:hypothetical protein [Paraburkholderia xenovorans]
MSTRTSKGRAAVQSGRAKLVVRRAFSMQEADAQLIETLRLRYATQGMLLNQSEVVRVGLRVLAEMTDAALCDSAARIERLTAVSRLNKLA